MIGNIIRIENNFVIAREAGGAQETYYLYLPRSNERLGRLFRIGEAVEWTPDRRPERMYGYRVRRVKTPIQAVEVSKQTCEEEGVGK